MTDTPTDEARLIQILKRHLDVTVEMLGQVLEECPEEAWNIPDEPAPVWQQLYHCLLGMNFWLRHPGQPFELPPFHTDEAGRLKGRAEVTITREKLTEYREVVVSQLAQLFGDLTLAELVRDADAGGVTLTLADHLFDQLRHLQHHLGSMHSQLRRRTGSPPQYISYTERKFLAAQGED